MVFEPLEFIEKLTALVPRPRVNLIRFHGALAPNATLRDSIIAAPKIQDKSPQGIAQTALPDLTKSKSQYKMSWASLLKRVFKIDVSICQVCKIGKIRIVSVIQEKQTITQILTHLGPVK